jgi:predicted DNA-binding transcriptional regulator YafY
MSGYVRALELDAERREAEAVPALAFDYTNWRGERSSRRARPLSLRFGASEWHPRPQALMRAFDLDKNEVREFAVDAMRNVVGNFDMKLTVMDPRAETPAAQWRERGEADPHGARYDCPREKTVGGGMTDDEAANAVFMEPTIANTTIAKDRIRWLSRQVERLGAGIQVALTQLRDRFEDGKPQPAATRASMARIVLERTLAESTEYVEAVRKERAGKGT